MIYLDHAATTPCAEDVVVAMLPYFDKKWGNPSSIYDIGREAREAITEAREKVAKTLGSSSNEIIFTSGATESNNLAIKGVVEASTHISVEIPHIITTQIEHHSVLDVVRNLEKNFKVETSYLSVSKEGLVDPKEIRAAIKENTVLVSVMMGNNEMGSIQPISEIGRIIQNEKTKRQKSGDKLSLVFHTDAVQAFAFLPIGVDELGVDMLSLTAHKFYGPKGVGVLYVRQGTKFSPQQHGGAQERGRRAGTENVPYIVGMAKAMEIASTQRDNYKQKTQKISEYLINRVTKEIKNVTLLGPIENKNRLPHIASFLFRGIEGESILINLDMEGITASSGSACTSGSLEPSHVTRAMGYSDFEAHGAVRFSIGKLNKKSDIDELMNHLPQIVNKLRAMSPVK